MRAVLTAEQAGALERWFAAAAEEAMKDKDGRPMRKNASGTGWEYDDEPAMTDADRADYVASAAGGDDDNKVLPFESVEQRRNRERQAFAQAMGEAGLGEAVATPAEGDEDDFARQCDYVMERMFSLLQAVPNLERSGAAFAPQLMEASAQVAQVYLNAAHALADHGMTLADRAERDRQIAAGLAHQARMEQAVEQAAARGQLLVPPGMPPGMPPG